MKITISGTLDARKRDAGAKINARFNSLAHDNLHADLVALASGCEPSVLKRESERLKLIERVEAAANPSSIDRILKDLRD